VAHILPLRVEYFITRYIYHSYFTTRVDDSTVTITRSQPIPAQAWLLLRFKGEYLKGAHRWSLSRVWIFTVLVDLKVLVHYNTDYCCRVFTLPTLFFPTLMTFFIYITMHFTIAIFFTVKVVLVFRSSSFPYFHVSHLQLSRTWNPLRAFQRAIDEVHTLPLTP